MKAEVVGGDGGEYTHSAAASVEEARRSEFVWDNDSHLYFHSGTGFYYDPGAGWYYSPRDGLYYNFENGAYIPILEFGKDSIPDHVPGRVSEMTGKETSEEEGSRTGSSHEGAEYRGFVWDDKSKLYFHADTGFYHDPAGGWYYSSNDGLYYRFEEGSYVPCLDSCRHSGDPCPDDTHSPQTPPDAAHCQISSTTTSMDPLGTPDTESMVENLEELPPPPSEWLEETLIDLYLAGPSTVHDPTFNIQNYGIPAEDTTNCQSCQSNQEDLQLYSASHASNQAPNSEDLGEDEEKWHALFCQVVISDVDLPMPLRAIDLWDWSFIVENEQDSARLKENRGTRQVARLLGRLNTTSVKLHPSMSSTSFLKTASICEVYLDLVRVATGKVYRLRNPGSAYLASLSSYDASNPTKDWDFPELDISKMTQTSTSAEPTASQSSIKDIHNKGSSAKHHQSSTRNTLYKDRAALRRALHGGYGIGFDERDATYEVETRPFSEVEAANISIGPGSYARRIMENMGWKEGEVLGKTQGGLVEPLKAVGNKGYAGLGWNGT